MRNPAPGHLAPPRTSADDGTLSQTRDHTRNGTVGSHRAAFDEDGEQRLFVLDTHVVGSALKLCN